MKKLFYIYLMIAPDLIYSQSLNNPPGGSGYGQMMGGNNGTNINIQGTQLNPNNPTGNPGPDHHERDIFWIHGLGGSASSWSTASGWAYDNYLVNCHSNITYTENQSIFGAGNSIRNDIGLYNQGDAEDFIIAHSQGGLVARAAIYDQYCRGAGHEELKSIGGFVTFGSPHQGARLLNNRAQFKTLAEELCKKLGRAYAYKLTNIKFTVNLPIVGKEVLHPFADIKLTEYFAKLVCDTIFDKVLKSYFIKLNPPITQSYEVGADHLNTMKNWCDGNRLDTMHKVAFYGVEDEVGLMLRTIKYFVEDANNFGQFGANEDNDYIRNAKANYDSMTSWITEFECDLKATMFKFFDRNCDIWPFKNNNPCLNKIIPYKNFLEKGIQALKEAQAFMSTLDEQYKAIIGAVEYQTTQEYYCICANPHEESEEKINDPLQCPIRKQGKYGWMNCSTSIVTKTVRKTKDSDGVVLAESAMDLPEATEMPQKMYITSHMQMRNNDALKHALEDLLFDAQLPNEHWFILTTK